MCAMSVVRGDGAPHVCIVREHLHCVCRQDVDCHENECACGVCKGNFIGSFFAHLGTYTHLL